MQIARQTIKMYRRLNAIVGVVSTVVSGYAGFADWRAQASRSYGIIIELCGLQSTLDVPVENSKAFKGLTHRHTVSITFQPLPGKQSILLLPTSIKIL